MMESITGDAWKMSDLAAHEGFGPPVMSTYVYEALCEVLPPLGRSVASMKKKRKPIYALV